MMVGLVPRVTFFCSDITPEWLKIIIRLKKIRENNKNQRFQRFQKPQTSMILVDKGVIYRILCLYFKPVGRIKIVLPTYVA